MWGGGVTLPTAPLAFHRPDEKSVAPRGNLRTAWQSHIKRRSFDRQADHRASVNLEGKIEDDARCTWRPRRMFDVPQIKLTSKVGPNFAYLVEPRRCERTRILAHLNSVYPDGVEVSRD